MYHQNMIYIYMSNNNIYINNAMEDVDLGVSKNMRTPKWMVKIMENPIF